MVLKATPARWYNTHKEDLTTRDAVQPAMIHKTPAVTESLNVHMHGVKGTNLIRGLFLMIKPLLKGSIKNFIDRLNKHLN